MSLNFLPFNVKTYLKFQLLKYKWKKYNKNNNTKPGRYFDIKRVNVGSKTYGKLNIYTFYGDKSKLSIGGYCSIADNVSFIVGGEHNTKCISTYPLKQFVLDSSIDSFGKGDIIVDDDVWIGYGATIMSGVHIGQGAVVAAGAVVTKDVPPYAIVGGVPAKVIKYRFEPEMIEELLKVDYSKLTKEDIEKHIDDLYTELKDPSQLDWMPKKG